MLVLVQSLEVLDERQHCGIVGSLVLDIGHLYVEGHWCVVEHVFLLEVTELLHYLEQVAFLGNEVVVFNMVYHLPLAQV